MVAFELEKGMAPPPAPIGSTGRVAKYPFSTMEVGDAFSVKATEAQPNPNASLKSLVSIYNKKLAPKKFTFRRTDDGARVFRIA